ncbi:fibrinogen C domain-containing protein 1-like [Gadus morhua]|uniref:fibrinogen C domain-containing protein 1-like n=1 Tax=Gadus morhua TaxID=8049 RepID=UPI0011B3B0A7|nr:fibrinogen C domain-containing protein 1-like [Gadus morhua]XP_056448741.1 fibrinogen C domain-containing protein 1-like [Gadus chalcogrammus]
MNERWTIMNNSASELDAKQQKSNKSCCNVLLWCILILLALLGVVAATMTVLYLNHYPLPFISRNSAALPGASPIISTNQKENGALVTVSLGDGEPLSIYMDPNCPDYSNDFLRWEEVQNSLLSLLRNHNTDNWQERGLVQKLGEELKLLAGHAHSMRVEAETLKRGQNALMERINILQSEQSRISQLLSESQGGVSKVVRSVADSLHGLQRETESLRTMKTELQKPNDFRQTKGFRPQDCSELLDAGFTQDGVYSIFPTHEPRGFSVYCDMTTDGGGWTVIQRRSDGSVNFFRGWTAYRDGFGQVTGEHWLGLQRMFYLTGFGHSELRIDIADFENGTAYASYGLFAVGLDSVNPDEDGYVLTVDHYSGTAGDSLLKHSGMQFTTKDRDQDQSENNCAAYYQGAWWYRNCHTSNLNGQYLRGGHASYADGVEWSSWTGWQYSLRSSEMKVRPNKSPAPRSSASHSDSEPHPVLN